MWSKLALLLFRLALAVTDDRCRFLDGPAGGGTCTCPDGSVFEVQCGSAACLNGTRGGCVEHAGPWSNKAVACATSPGGRHLSATQQPRSPPRRLQPSSCADTATVAYTFLTREMIPWDVWDRYFAGCPGGSAVPVIHSQDTSAGNRAKLQARLEPYGGVLVSEAETLQGDPRFSFLMTAMQFALWRAAGGARAPNGCAPRWVHLLSESDLPAATCAEVHKELLRGSVAGEDVSYLHVNPATTPAETDLLGLRGPFIDGGAPAELLPLAKTSQWVTLALPHALALAADECALVEKWRPHMVHPDWPWPYDAPGVWRGVLTASKKSDELTHINYGSSEEFLFYTELAQRELPFSTSGLTKAFYGPEWKPWLAQGVVFLTNDDFSHPSGFTSEEDVRAACEYTRSEGYFFFRKVKAAPQVAVAALRGCGCLP